MLRFYKKAVQSHNDVGDYVLCLRLLSNSHEVKTMRFTEEQYRAMFVIGSAMFMLGMMMIPSLLMLFF